MTADEPLPLAGLTVLDISSFIAAPAAAAALGDGWAPASEGGGGSGSVVLLRQR